MKPLRVAVVDDEPLARSKIVRLLEGEDHVELVGEAGDGPAAVELLRAVRPEVVFLDVQMPGLDGFQVVERVGVERMPAVIFVTAFDEHALRAFDVAAVDYLLKPFARDRFREALDRARDRRRTGVSRQVLQRVLDTLDDPGETPMKRFVIRSTGRIVIVDAEDVDWIAADGNYVRLHAGGRTHLARATLSGLEERLDPARFLRIHRSTLVNVARVAELRPGGHGDFILALDDGTRLTSSRAYHGRIEAWVDAGCPVP